MNTVKDGAEDKVMAVDPQSKVPEEQPSTALEGTDNESVIQSAFLPGSIHKKGVRTFWKKNSKPVNG
jgi:hypothetical protein